ncbi:hypothetical protein PV783_11490 [Chitinophaga sp. CC14]|uniref:hypothetical protein n=1 Tax=Chitinophaga sp. CC14 TaxID=3029199 RepID=UPI003B75DAA6
MSKPSREEMEKICVEAIRETYGIDPTKGCTTVAVFCFDMGYVHAANREVQLKKAVTLLKKVRPIIYTKLEKEISDFLLDLK